MSDLDELASAARGPGGRGPQDPRMVPGYMPPEPPRSRVLFWLALGVFGVVVLLVTFGVLMYAGQRVTSPPVALPLPPGTAPATTVPTTPSAGAGTAAAPVPPAAPVTRPARARQPLQDIADPYQALDIYHLKRGVGDTIEIKARNLGKRGLFVKSVELYAESNDRVPLDNIGFWLPPGEAIIASREVLELSRRLSDDEPVKAVVNEAEFRDTAPAPDELGDQPSGTSNRDDAE
jgi:hypothetical protein